MTEYRFGRVEEEEDILDFINLVFSQAVRPHHFDTLLPKVYAHPGYGPLHALAVSDGRIRGAVAMLPVTVNLAGNVLRGGYIGSVSVHEKARGEGHMKRLMAMQIEEAKRRGYDFMALGGRRQRYGYYGFEKSGGLMEFHINADNVRHALRDVDDSWVVIREITGDADGALEEIQRLHSGQIFFCDRPRMLDTLRSWNARAYGIRHAGTGEFRGFLAAQDSQIYELTLENEEDVPAVVKAWMRGKKECTVYTPCWNCAMNDALKAFAENYGIGDHMMLKILNWPRALDSALKMKWVYQAMAPGAFVAQIEGRSLKLTVSEEEEITVEETEETSDRVLTEKQATELFFSPYAALTEENAALRSWLPLPLFLPLQDHF